jgi:hypothetical protein
MVSARVFSAKSLPSKDGGAKPGLYEGIVLQDSTVGKVREGKYGTVGR